MILAEQQWSDLISEYKDGALAPALAKKYGIHVTTLHKKLKTLGVQKQSRSYVSRKASGYELDETVFDELTPESLYWLGFLFADGNVSGSQIQMNLSRKDRGHLEKFKAFMKSGHSIYDGVMPGNEHRGASEYSKFIFCSTKIRDRLYELGLTERKSLTAKAPEEVLDSTDFWRGVIDGDGSVSIHDKKEVTTGKYTYTGYKTPILFLCGSHTMVGQFAEFVCRSTKFVGKILPRGNTSEFKVQGNTAKPVVELLYKDAIVYLERKYEIAQEIIEGDFGVEYLKAKNIVPDILVEGSASGSTKGCKRNNGKTLTYKGQTMSVAEWAKVLNMKYVTLLARTYKGWSDEEIIEKAKKKWNKQTN